MPSRQIKNEPLGICKACFKEVYENEEPVFLWLKIFHKKCFNDYKLTDEELRLVPNVTVAEKNENS